MTQWIIYDAYNEDFSKQQEEKEKEKKDKIAVHASKKSVSKKKQNDVTEDQTEKNMLITAKFLERIINLNTMDAIAQGTYCVTHNIIQLENIIHSQFISNTNIVTHLFNL